ncbi:plasmid mobilization relaxosome protein MobC [Nocardia vinacea]|uniref:plasmid mobilization protein n=1 Tax=Nocardia vinacea TaxID=96468 RepID=UPI0034345C30
MSDAEQAALKARASEAGMTVPRLMVETTLEGERVEAGRAAAVVSVLEMDTQIRRIGANLNQLTRYAHQERELPEQIELALRAVTRACLSLDATARWVMGKAPAVTEVSIGEQDLSVELPPDLDDSDADSWANQIDG